MSVNHYINTHLFIPRLCNGSTSDSGSDCGGSNPPWGTQAESEMVQLFLCIVPAGIAHRVQSVPSNIGLVRGPLKAERRVRFPQEPRKGKN